MEKEYVPEYHKASELRGRTGYWPNLDDEQKAALKEMKSLMSKHSIVLRTQENTTLLLLRFLRARNFDVSRAWDMFSQDVVWRNDNNIDSLCSQTPEEVLGCDPVSIYKYFPTWLQGFDKQGRPVAYRQYGHFEIWELLNLTSMDRLIRFHTWEVEQQVYLMLKQTQLMKVNIETFVIVVDAAHWGLRLATRDAYRYIKGMLDVDSNHYPERLGRIFIINAPSTLSLAWKMISRWTDPVTARKISILSDPSAWQPLLFESVDRSQVPVMYGGDAADPTEESLRCFDPEAMLEEFYETHTQPSTSTEDSHVSKYVERTPQMPSSYAKHDHETKEPEELSKNEEDPAAPTFYEYAATRVGEWTLWITGSTSSSINGELMSRPSMNSDIGTSTQGYRTPEGSIKGDDDDDDDMDEPPNPNPNPNPNTTRVTRGGVTIVYDTSSADAVVEGRSRGHRSMGTQTPNSKGRFGLRKKRLLRLRKPGAVKGGCCVVS